MKVAQRPTALYVSANSNMDQQKRPRPTSLSIQLPQARPLSALLATEMSYHRQLSPGSRRLNNPGRVSDSAANTYGYERNNSYTSPRASVGGVIPISTQTFVNVPPPAGTVTTRPPESREGRPEAYSGRVQGSYTDRPRRSSLIDNQRASISSGTSSGSRARPNVIQNDPRPSSPLKGSRDNYYVTSGTSTSKEPRKAEHKKLYSVSEGTSSLVADIDVPAAPPRHHRRRDSDSGDRAFHKGSSIDRERERGGYHLNGPSRPREKSIEDEDAYSYTDAAGMFRDTAPVWREARPRRASIDRAGGSRERPVNLMDDARKSNRDIGPPPSTRGWDKLNEGIGRATSMRERPRNGPQSPTRARVPQSPNRARVPQSPTRGRYPEKEYGDSYYVPPRTNSADRHNMPINPRYDQYDYDERREPRRYERRNSMTRQDQAHRQDQSVERRGFGIRAESQDRYARGSEDSFDRQNRYRDSGYAVAEPHRRDTAPELNYAEERRLEQDKNDRMAAERARNEDRERQWLNEARDKDPRRRDDDRGSHREYERHGDTRAEQNYNVDRERELQRERMMQPHQGQEKHHHRRESNRDYDYGKDNAPRNSGEQLAQPGLAQTAATGLAGAAAAYGLNKAFNRNDDRDQQERLSPRPPAAPPATHSDEGPPPQHRDEHRPSGQDRGLGFAFEHPPEPPRSAPPMRDHPEPQRYPDPTETDDLGRSRRQTQADDLERSQRLPEKDRAGYQERPQAYDRHRAENDAPAAAPAGPVDADEDYRRRMEQVHRELGRGPEDRNADSDPERERRRREREQRFREREQRNGDSHSVLSNATYDSMASSRMPGGYENGSVDGTNSTASRPSGLTRKPSILDQAMTNEPAQIIDNSMSDRRENRVRIVDPPTEEEAPKPRGILKKPTEKFPEHPNTMREGVAPLKDVSRRGLTPVIRFTNEASKASKSGIPPGARWTKIDRKLVNPEALEDAKERFEERLDCVIVLRVLTKEEIQKLADRTSEIRRKYRLSHSSTSSSESWSPPHDYFAKEDHGQVIPRAMRRPLLPERDARAS